MIGYIIGNGKSRKDFDLFKLKGLIVGCNALYRDPNPAEYIVAVDSGMAKEINANYSGNLVLQNPVVSDGKANRIMYKPSYRNKTRSSGALATDFAISKGVTTIYWLGFDNPKKSLFKEASYYAGTSNYIRNNSWGYKVFTLEYQELVGYHKNIKFINIIKEGISNPMLDKRELGNFLNYSVITYEEFEKSL